MNTLKRWLRNWLGITLGGTYPHRFVTLVTWHDKIIGVDGNGDIYELVVSPYSLEEVYVQLMMKNPLER